MIITCGYVDNLIVGIFRKFDKFRIYFQKICRAIFLAFFGLVTEVRAPSSSAAFEIAPFVNLKHNRYFSIGLILGGQGLRFPPCANAKGAGIRNQNPISVFKKELFS